MTADRIALGCAVLPFVLVACSARGDDARSNTDPDGTSSETGGDATTTAGGDSVGDSSDETDAGAEDDDGGEDDGCGGFLGCGPDVPATCASVYGVDPTPLARGEWSPRSRDSCDIWARDCPAGDRCTPIDACGTVAFDAHVCVPHGSVAVGAACQFTEGPQGADTCDTESMCIGAGGEGSGTCVELCNAPQQAPTCDTPGSRCIEYFGGLLPLCVPPCDPLDADPCPATNEACLATGFDDATEQTGTASCVPIEAPTGSLPGDPCAGIGWCDAGQACIRTGWAQQLCGAPGCCEDLCELGGTNCATGYTCRDFHDVEHPALGYCSPA